MTLPLDIILVRHGQSEGNAAKRRSEAGDHSAFSEEFRKRHTASFRLTDLGKEQARLAGQWIRDFLDVQDWKFDRYLTSEYIRAKETAALLGLHQAEWMCDPYLSERDWGNLEQMPEKERNEKFGEALRQRDAEPFFWRPPNGESFMGLSLRIDRVLDTFHRECNEKRVIAVCHGEVIRAFQLRIERIPRAEFKRSILSDESEDRIHNCQIVHYSRRNPKTGEVARHANWVRWIRPTDEPVTEVPWREITRRRYTNEDLLTEVEGIPQLVS